MVQKLTENQEMFTNGEALVTVVILRTSNTTTIQAETTVNLCASTLRDMDTDFSLRHQDGSIHARNNTSHVWE